MTLPAWITAKTVAVALAALLLITGAIGGYRHIAALRASRDKAALEERLRTATDGYNQAIGAARARELAAREDAAKAEALAEEYKQRAGNVAAIDKKLDAVEKRYEADKAGLGECADADDCLARLRRELCAAGFKSACD